MELGAKDINTNHECTDQRTQTWSLQQDKHRDHHGLGWKSRHISLLFTAFTSSDMHLSTLHSLSLIPHHTFAHRNSAHLSGTTRWQVDLVFFFQPVTNCPEYACESPCPTQSTMVLDRNMIPYYSLGKFTLDLYVVSSEIFFSILVLYKFCVSCLFVVVHYWSSCLSLPYCRSYLCQ